MVDWQLAQPMDSLGERMSGRPMEQMLERQRLDLPLERMGPPMDWKWGRPLDPPLEQLLP